MKRENKIMRNSRFLPNGGDLMKKKIFISLLACIILCVFFGNRYLYGTWNPFGNPEKVYCYGRVYYASSNPPMEVNNPGLFANRVSSFNSLTGKRLYLMEPKKGDFVPAIIYLYLGNNQYAQYALSGGP
jgi:hypothetical protein